MKLYRVERVAGKVMGVGDARCALLSHCISGVDGMDSERMSGLDLLLSLKLLLFRNFLYFISSIFIFFAVRNQL